MHLRKVLVACWAPISMAASKHGKAIFYVGKKTLFLSRPLETTIIFMGWYNRTLCSFSCTKVIFFEMIFQKEYRRVTNQFFSFSRVQTQFSYKMLWCSLILLNNIIECWILNAFWNSFTNINNFMKGILNCPISSSGKHKML